MKIIASAFQVIQKSRVVAHIIMIVLGMTSIIEVMHFSFTKTAFADSGPYENLPPASIGNRNASLFVGIDPPVLTTNTRQDVTMLFRLFDANTNQSILYTTYYISVTKGIKPDQSPLLQDFFQAPNGLLALKIHPSEEPVQIFGNQDPFLHAWVADPGGTVNMRGPILSEGGIYHFHIEIFTVDNLEMSSLPRKPPILILGLMSEIFPTIVCSIMVKSTTAQ